MTHEHQHHTGIVERVEFTHGGMGNQWTTIGGVRYMTFWDIRTIDWKEGDRVTFDAVNRTLWNEQSFLMAENIRKAAPEVVYLTNACGEDTGNGSIELTGADYAKVPFEDGPGAVLLYLVEIEGRAHVLGNLEVAYQDEFWGEAAGGFMPEADAIAYCNAAIDDIKPRLADVHGILVPLDDGMPGRFVIGVSIPLDGLANRDATSMALAQAFGVVADLPSLPFVDQPGTADKPGMTQGPETAQPAGTIDLSMTWGGWGNIYRRFAESGETKAIRHLREDFAKAMAAAEAFRSIQDTLSEEQKKTAGEVMVREIGKQGF